jgi:hypothetical protein
MYIDENWKGTWNHKNLNTVKGEGIPENMAQQKLVNLLMGKMYE